MSKRRQAHLGFTKKSKTNDSVEQQEASSSADDAFFRATDTTAAPAGKPATCESPPTPGPGVTGIQDGPTEAGDGVNGSSEAADGGDSLHLPLSPGYGISEVVLHMLMHT